MRRWGLAAAVLLVAACGRAPGAAEPDPPAPSSAPSVPGIEVEAVQLRTDAAVGGRFQVRVTVTGKEPVGITSVALDSPGFAPVPAVEKDTEIEPGRVVDLRTPLGPVRCGAEAEPAVALLTVVRGGGSAEELRVPMPAEVLGRIHDRACAAEALAEVVAVTVTAVRTDGDDLVGRLALTRRSGGEEVRAVRVSRSVLVGVAADLPLVLAGDAREADVEVRFTPATCEPHVLAETKQPFRFPLGVEVADEDEVVIDLPVTAALRTQLQELVARVCR